MKQITLDMVMSDGPFVIKQEHQTIVFDYSY